MGLEAAARRERLRELLQAAGRPLTGGELSQALGVSRQVVVQDVAILRAAGEAILATPRGYLLAATLGPARLEAVLAVRHAPADAETELTALVDAGVRVMDVAVEHPLYGELRGLLLLESRADVADWLARAHASRAHMLSELTDGLHLHAVQATRPEALDRARSALRALGFLVEDEVEDEVEAGGHAPPPRPLGWRGRRARR